MSKIPGWIAAWLSALATMGCRSPEDAGHDPVAAAIAAGREGCDRYLACVVDTAPEGLSDLLALYGPEGSCWKTDELEAIDLCARACTASRDNLAALHPAVGTCGACSRDEDCADVDGRPRCDTGSSSCVGCLGPDDCPGGVCETQTRACVGCVTRDDCATDEACVARACVPEPRCTPDLLRCVVEGGAVLERCDEDGVGWVVETDCRAAGETCSAGACIYTAYGPCTAGGQCPTEFEVCIAVDAGHGYCFNTFAGCEDALDCPEPTPGGASQDVRCVEDVCSLACEADAACPAGMVCVAGVCAWGG